MDQMSEAKGQTEQETQLAALEKSLRGTVELEDLKYAIGTVARQLVDKSGKIAAQEEMKELLTQAGAFATGTEEPKDVTKATKVEYLGMAIRKAKARAAYETSKPPGIVSRVFGALKK